MILFHLLSRYVLNKSTSVSICSGKSRLFPGIVNDDLYCADILNATQFHLKQASEHP